MSGYEREHKSYLKVAVWRDPVERLISAYKYFILERTFNRYMYMCNLYQDHSFERFLSFVEFELGRQIRCGRMNIYAGNLIFILLQRWIVLYRSVN